jgi:hypothetical protein
MPNTIHVETQKSLKVVNSQEKVIIVEEIFLYIGKKMLSINYTLNLGQLLKIAFELKKYLWQKLKLNKTHNLSKATTINKLVL